MRERNAEEHIQPQRTRGTQRLEAFFQHLCSLWPAVFGNPAQAATFQESAKSRSAIVYRRFAVA